MVDKSYNISIESIVNSHWYPSLLDCLADRVERSKERLTVVTDHTAVCHLQGRIKETREIIAYLNSFKRQGEE